MTQEIKIQAKEVDQVSVDVLLPHPKNMNRHSSAQIERLTELIRYQGWRNPLVVQKGTNLVVAGHGRLEAAKKLGLKTVPVTYQEFESEAQLYAYMVSDNAIAEWAELDRDAIKLELPDLDLDLDLLGFEAFEIEIEEYKNGAEEEKYTRKVEAPIYEITGEKPEIKDVYDKSKTEELLFDIEGLDADDETKEFLRLAAHRHTKFNYKKIAELYAHSSEEVQTLMENSALVVIDFNKAIELGFVKLTKKIEESYRNDYP